MKLKNIYGFFLMVLVLMFSSCEPIEDRDVLSNTITSVDDIELSVIQEGGGNSFTLQMTTPGVTGYWDFITATKWTDRVDVVFPVTGEFTFDYYMSTPFMTNGKPSEKEYFTKSITVNIENLTVPLADEYYNIAGTTLDGKTWVFAGEPLDGGTWWYMSDFLNWESVWWNAAGECCPPANKDFVLDSDAEMTFKILGEYIYSLNGEETEGVKWEISEDLTTLTLSDPTVIPGYQNEWGEPRANPDGKYQIVELTEDRLVLFTPVTINSGVEVNGWTWVFVPKS